MKEIFLQSKDIKTVCFCRPTGGGGGVILWAVMVIMCWCTYMFEKWSYFRSKGYFYLFVGNPKVRWLEMLRLVSLGLIFSSLFEMTTCCSVCFLTDNVLLCRRMHCYSNTLMLSVLANSAPRSLKVILSSALTILVQVSWKFDKAQLISCLENF